MDQLKRTDPRRTIRHKNVACPYCNAPLTPPHRFEEEHVIGRRFVPKGTLAGQWNLILRACGPCNDAKADLENDISAITMQPDAAGRHASDDALYMTEAQRKGRTTNRRTGRHVAEPEPPIDLHMPFAGGGGITLNFVHPAQVDDGRLFQLARLQLMGFFFHLTYNEDSQRGWYWPGAFMPVVAARKGDWGHPHLRWVCDTADGWEWRLYGNAADGYFKLWIKRQSGEQPVWAWAIEWNKNFRLAGFFGDTDRLDDLRSAAPQLRTTVIHEWPDRWMRWREETPLAEEADVLFDPPKI